MRLFLTSSPCDDDGAADLPIPFVFRKDNGFAVLLRERTLPEGRAVMLAAYPDLYEHNDAMARDFASAFSALGRPLETMHMLDGRDTPEEISRAVRDADLVLLAGGHVPTQNRWFHRIGLADALKGFEGVVMGISAGSMNSCGNVYAQPEEAGEAADPFFKRFIPGLALTDVMILPHYQMVKDNLIDGQHLFRDISIPDSRGRTFYAIPDGSFVLQENGKARLYGEAWKLHDGTMEKFSEYGEVREI